jgi:hypothetical protein
MRLPHLGSVSREVMVMACWPQFCSSLFSCTRSACKFGLLWGEQVLYSLAQGCPQRRGIGVKGRFLFAAVFVPRFLEETFELPQ